MYTLDDIDEKFSELDLSNSLKNLLLSNDSYIEGLYNITRRFESIYNSKDRDADINIFYDKISDFFNSHQDFTVKLVDIFARRYMSIGIATMFVEIFSLHTDFSMLEYFLLDNEERFLQCRIYDRFLFLIPGLTYDRSFPRDSGIGKFKSIVEILFTRTYTPYYNTNQFLMKDDPDPEAVLYYVAMFFDERLQKGETELNLYDSCLRVASVINKLRTTRGFENFVKMISRYGSFFFIFLTYLDTEERISRIVTIIEMFDDISILNCGLVLKNSIYFYENIDLMKLIDILKQTHLYVFVDYDTPRTNVRYARILNNLKNIEGSNVLKSLYAYHIADFLDYVPYYSYKYDIDQVFNKFNSVDSFVKLGNLLNEFSSLSDEFRMTFIQEINNIREDYHATNIVNMVEAIKDENSAKKLATTIYYLFPHYIEYIITTEYNIHKKFVDVVDGFDIIDLDKLSNFIKTYFYYFHLLQVLQDASIPKFVKCFELLNFNGINNFASYLHLMAWSVDKFANILNIIDENTAAQFAKAISATQESAIKFSDMTNKIQNESQLLEFVNKIKLIIDSGGSNTMTDQNLDFLDKMGKSRFFNPKLFIEKTINNPNFKKLSIYNVIDRFSFEVEQIQIKVPIPIKLPKINGKLSKLFETAMNKQINITSDNIKSAQVLIVRNGDNVCFFYNNGNKVRITENSVAVNSGLSVSEAVDLLPFDFGNMSVGQVMYGLNRVLVIQ